MRHISKSKLKPLFASSLLMFALLGCGDDSSENQFDETKTQELASTYCGKVQSCADADGTQCQNVFTENVRATVATGCIPAALFYAAMDELMACASRLECDDFRAFDSDEETPHCQTESLAVVQLGRSINIEDPRCKALVGGSDSAEEPLLHRVH